MEVEPDIATLHVFQGCSAFYQRDYETALVEYEMALAIRETGHARFGRAHALLALGRYRDGFVDFDARWTVAKDELTERGRRFRAELPRWHGEPGKHVVILAECGFGDVVQLLRYIPLVRAISASVTLEMPPALARLASQLAPIATDETTPDCCATIFEMMTALDVTVDAIPRPPYLRPDEKLWHSWARKIGYNNRHKIGIAWSTKFDGWTEHENQRRPIPLQDFLRFLDAGDCQIYSLQTQERDEARAFGVEAYPFEDFADVAAIAALMDEVVSIDTAALHVAGAIGHPTVYAMLPWAATWRWLNGNPWYPRMRLCQQTSPGDWASAFNERRN
jgi:hypothetical protein